MRTNLGGFQDLSWCLQSSNRFTVVIQRFHAVSSCGSRWSRPMSNADLYWSGRGWEPLTCPHTTGKIKTLSDCSRFPREELSRGGYFSGHVGVCVDLAVWPCSDPQTNANGQVFETKTFSSHLKCTSTRPCAVTMALQPLRNMAIMVQKASSAQRVFKTLIILWFPS